MIELYSEEKYFEGGSVGYVNYEEQEKALRMTFARQIRALYAMGATGEGLLDVGCGYGYFLEEAKDFFTYRVGTDFSAHALMHASKRCSEVFQGGVSEVPPERRFKLITAIQVIEHVYNPYAFLEEIIKYLAPQGQVFLATPNIGSFWHFFLRRRWPSFKIPEHVLYYSRISLSELMKKCGLVNIREVYYPHAFPLSLFASKFGIKFKGPLTKLNVWVPETTIAFIGQKGTL